MKQDLNKYVGTCPCLTQLGAALEKLIHNKYLVFNESQARYFIITGGRGSGKSFAVNSVLLLLTYQAGHTILFTRYTLRAASISIIPEFIEKLELLGVIDQFKITKDTQIHGINCYD